MSLRSRWVVAGGVWTVTLIAALFIFLATSQLAFAVKLAPLPQRQRDGSRIQIATKRNPVSTPIHREGQLPLLTIQRMLAFSIRKKSIEQFKLYLRQLPANRAGFLNTPINENKDRLIHLATDGNQFEIIEILLVNGARIDSLNMRRETPLHLASKKANSALCELLVRHDADVNAKMIHGETALHLASESGDLSIIQILLDAKATLDPYDLALETPLVRATKANKLAAMELLLQAQANVEAANFRGQTALHWAGMLGLTRAAQVLLNYNSDPNVQDQVGFTPLHWAVNINAPIELIETLIEANTNVTLRSKAGHTAEELSSLNGYVQITDKLSIAASVGQLTKEGDRLVADWAGELPSPGTAISLPPLVTTPATTVGPFSPGAFSPCALSPFARLPFIFGYQ
jgi:ankyrin repeat protein